MTAVEPATRTRGGQPGNRNALKSGRHTAQMRALRRDARLELQKIKAAIAMAMAARSGPGTPASLREGGWASTQSAPMFQNVSQQ